MPVYWPTEKENPLLISQLKVDTTGSQMIEEGVLQMYEFQVFIKRKVIYHQISDTRRNKSQNLNACRFVL